MIRPKERGEMHFRTSIPVNAPLAKAWPIITDTERLNRAMGEPSFEFRESPSKTGGSIRIGKQKKAGFLLEFQEFPFQWVENKYYSLERQFRKGPMSWYALTYTFEDKGDHFVAHFDARIKLKLPFLAPKAWQEMRLSYIPRLKKAYKQVEEFLKGSAEAPLPPEKHRIQSVNEKLRDDLLRLIGEFSWDQSLNEKMTRYFLDTPEFDLARIKPFAVARKIGEHNHKVLGFLLRGAKANYLNLNWDLLCPSCRGAKSSSRTLREMETNVHCSSCNIRFDADFDKSIELTFSPTPKIREIFEFTYCIGGPGNTPHVLSQIRIAPQGSEVLEFDLAPGAYRLYSPQLENTLVLDATTEEDEGHPLPLAAEIEFGTLKDSKRIAVLPGKRMLRFINPFDYEISVKLERTEWLRDIVTAFDATTLQEFRELFPFEALRPGMDIGVRNISILFTDIRNSTAFYNQRGDAAAFKTVIDHFELLIKEIAPYHGAIVKTIGDAVMAVFSSPTDAVRYALHVQEEIQKLNEKYGETRIVLKIGVHFGPALAVNLNDKLDYFGQTVNIAARIVSKCEGGDIVITRKTYEDEEVRQAVFGYPTQVFEADLKGFEESESLVRIRPILNE